MLFRADGSSAAAATRASSTAPMTDWSRRLSVLGLTGLHDCSVIIRWVHFPFCTHCTHIERCAHRHLKKNNPRGRMCTSVWKLWAMHTNIVYRCTSHRHQRSKALVKLFVSSVLIVALIKKKIVNYQSILRTNPGQVSLLRLSPLQCGLRCAASEKEPLASSE